MSIQVFPLTSHSHHCGCLHREATGTESKGLGANRLLIKIPKNQAVVVHAFNPQNSGGRSRQMSEFKTSLAYRVSPSTVRAAHRNPVGVGVWRAYW